MCMWATAFVPKSKVHTTGSKVCLWYHECVESCKKRGGGGHKKWRSGCPLYDQGILSEHVAFLQPDNTDNGVT